MLNGGGISFSTCAELSDDESSIIFRKGMKHNYCLNVNITN
jgi:hypothetical protein